MKFLHWTVDAGPRDVIAVDINRQANVMVMDSANYNAFRRSRRFRYLGGCYRQSPVHLVPNSQRRWNVVVMPLPGSRVSASVSILKGGC